MERSKHDGGHRRPGPATSRRWNFVAVVLAVLSALGAALAPFGESTRSDSAGNLTTSRVSLLSSDGPGVLMIVAVPALLIAVPLLLRGEHAARRARVLIVGLLACFVVLGALSVGIFFLPALIAMALSVATASPTRAAVVVHRRAVRDERHT